MRKIQKKEQIMETAIRLFAEEGVGVATAKIAKKAEVSNGTLFNYFGTKQVLFDEVYVYIKEKMSQAMLKDIDVHADIKQLFYESWLAYALWSQKNPLHSQTMKLLIRSPVLSQKAKEKGESFWGFIFDNIKKNIEEKKILDVPVELITVMGHGYLESLIEFSQSRKLKDNQIQENIKKGFEMFWRGISLK